MSRKIFLSYQRRDEDKANHLRRQLDLLRHEVWVDKEGLHDDQSADAVVRAEQKSIKTRLRKRVAIASTAIPVLFEGDVRDAFPPAFEDQVHVDMTDSRHYFTRLELLVLRLLGIPQDHPGVAEDALSR